MIPAWAGPAFSLELRKLLAHRADFWMDFLGGLLAQIGLAYFLWKAIFLTRDATTIGGFTFLGMMLYYVLVPGVEKITRGPELGFLFSEIYEGSLTRYLVYPVDFFAYKYIQHLAISFLAILQLLLVLGLFAWWAGIPEGMAVTPGSVARGLVAALAASVLYFRVASCLEMVSFWADNVWSLLVMLRFAIRLLGGGMLPLSLFPDSLQLGLQVLPFRYLLAFPIETLIGQVGLGGWFAGLGMVVAWSLVFWAVSRWIFRRGSLQYTGVGI